MIYKAKFVSDEIISKLPNWLIHFLWHLLEENVQAWLLFLAACKRGTVHFLSGKRQSPRDYHALSICRGLQSRNQRSD